MSDISIQQAAKWAREQNFGSVTARYAKVIVNAFDEQAAELERLRALVADYEEAAQITLEDCGAPDEKHCSCVPTLRSEIERLEEAEIIYQATQDILNNENQRLRAQVAELQAAGRAVVERWDTPLWKDAEPTAKVINALRRALEQSATPDASERQT